MGSKAFVYNNYHYIEAFSATGKNHREKSFFQGSNNDFFTNKN